MTKCTPSSATFSRSDRGAEPGGDRPFPTLPRESYFEPRWFEAELEAIFGCRWLYAGHISELAEIGDFFIREVGLESIILTRGSDGPHAFFNVCRHRGARICSEPRGHVKRFICPYHRWSYGIDGELLGAPSMDDLVEKRDYPLIPAHVEE